MTIKFVFKDEVVEQDIEQDTLIQIKLLKGEKGDTGDTGSTGATGNGIVSLVKTGTSGLIDTYTITYTNGNTDTITVTNGKDGTNGTNGQDGSTPVRGTDYWTNQDISAIEQHCDTYIDTKIGSLNSVVNSIEEVVG